jgi:hypothetical protein
MESRYYRNGSVISGVMLIMLGLIFFAATQGAFGLDWGNMWPLFPALAGLAMLVMALVADNPKARVGWVLPGTIALLMGGFFVATTSGILSWSDQAVLWPIYPLVVGVAFLAAYVASGFREPGYLIPGAIISLAGLAFLGIMLTGTSYAYIGQIWPIFLILAGVLILILPRMKRMS